jgi:hypothetical protein
MKNSGVIAISPLRINDISEELNVIVMNGKLSLSENESEDWGVRQSQPFWWCCAICGRHWER